jgi:rod shape determining protein RodA
MNFAVGMVLFFIIRKIGWKFFPGQREAYLLGIHRILIVTYIIGVEVKVPNVGSTCVFPVPGSEFSDFLYPVFRGLLFEIERGTRSYRHLLASLFYFLLPTFIVFKQLDLGNAMVYVFIYFSMLMFSPFRKSRFFTSCRYVGGCAFRLVFHEGLPEGAHPQFHAAAPGNPGNAYNMIQAVITIGFRQIPREGIGPGTQSKLFFLPENSTDFAYSSLVEQFGFAGGFLTLSLYMVHFYLLSGKPQVFLRRMKRADSHSCTSWHHVVHIFPGACKYRHESRSASDRGDRPAVHILRGFDDRFHPDRVCPYSITECNPV